MTFLFFFLKCNFHILLTLYNFANGQQPASERSNSSLADSLNAAQKNTESTKWVTAGRLELLLTRREHRRKREHYQVVAFIEIGAFFQPFFFALLNIFTPQQPETLET